MSSPRRFALAFALLVPLAACGGGSDDTTPVDGDDGAAGTPTPADDSGDAEVDTDAAEPIDEDESGDGSATDDSGDPGSGGALTTIAPSMTIPSVGGFGEAIALSPDGSRLAHLEGGLEAPITIYDTATGEVLMTGFGTGQGFDPHWTADDRLVTWDPSPTFADDTSIWPIDANTLEALPPIVPVGDSGLTICDPINEFASFGDVVFSAGSRDDDAMVCRLDLSTNELSTAPIDIQNFLPQAFVSDDGTQVVVSDIGALASDPSNGFVLDAATLAPIETLELPGALIAIAPGGIVVANDGPEQSFLGGGSLEGRAAALNDIASPFIVGSVDLDIVIMDGSGGVIGSLGAGFPVESEASADGTTIAIRTTDSILVVTP